MPPEWISTEEAAKLSGYNVEYVRRLMRKGKVKAEKRGSMWWIDRESMEAYVRHMSKLGTAKFDPTGAADENLTRSE